MPFLFSLRKELLRMNLLFTKYEQCLHKLRLTMEEKEMHSNEIVTLSSLGPFLISFKCIAEISILLGQTFHHVMPYLLKIFPSCNRLQNIKTTLAIVFEAKIKHSSKKKRASLL